MEPVRGRGGVVFTRHRDHRVSNPRALRAALRSGEMIQLRSGACVRSAVWQALTFDERRRLEVAAAIDAARDGLVVSHRSAGALWGIPSIRRRDGLVDVRTTMASGSRSEHGFREHAVQDPEQHVVEALGLRVTSLARTVVDLALSDPFTEAVTAIDWALAHGLTQDVLLSTLDQVAPKQGRAKAERAIRFGDASSGSAGESWSRAQMEEAGLVMPVLQARFSDTAGFIGAVDFSWPDFELIGEFDGLKKYREAEMLAGRTPGGVVEDEKVREDRLRATPTRPRVTRWIWRTLAIQDALAEQLLAAGVRRR